MAKSDKSEYELTGQELDKIISTIATLVPTGFVFSLINNEEHYSFARLLSWLIVFGLGVLLIHFLSYLAAHYAQIEFLKSQSDSKNTEHLKLYRKYGGWVNSMNQIVYCGIIIQIILAMIVFTLIY